MPPVPGVIIVSLLTQPVFVSQMTSLFIGGCCSFELPGTVWSSFHYTRHRIAHLWHELFPISHRTVPKLRR